MPFKLRFGALAILPLVIAGCQTATNERSSDYGDLGDHRRPITTRSSTAQRKFNEGLVLIYAFNHDEAVRSLEAALEADPECAMAWWGIAYALGPNINAPMEDPVVAKRAYEAAQNALARSETCTAVERELIRAVSKRYAMPPPSDRKALDEAYARAMESVWRKFPSDTDVGALYAESLLDLSPWNQWSPDGQPKPNTLELVAALERVMELDPRHPLANHLYIHAVEASPNPERALPAARRLETLVPAAGHLVHMPAHIYIRIGRYSEAADANEKAIAMDRKYFARVGPKGIYEFYRAHNHHFLAYSAMFEGRRDRALQAARDLIAELPAALLEAIPGVLDGFFGVPVHVMVRFGLWDEILAEPMPAESFPLAQASWHYARALALVNLGRLSEAEVAAADFAKASQRVGPESRFGNNAGQDIVAVGEKMLEGELLFRKGQHDAAFAALREAIRREEALRYDEPAGWMQPVRHALGALLLETGRVEEAEAVYRADLVRHPENGWALHGLAECLRERGSPAEASEVEARQARAWSRADTQISASCACRQS